jgi:hypothetical protein
MHESFERMEYTLPSSLFDRDNQLIYKLLVNGKIFINQI